MNSLDIAELENRFIPILGTTFLMTKAELDNFVAIQKRDYDAQRLGLLYQQINTLKSLEQGVDV